MLAFYRLLSERSGVRLSPGARSTGTSLPLAGATAVANQSAIVALQRTASLLLAVAFGLSIAIPAMTYAAPEGGYHHMGPAQSYLFHQARGQHEVNVPEWSSVAADFPACSGRTDVLAAEVIVVDSGDDAHRLPFDRAWDLNHDAEHANNVWVVGTC